MPEDKQFLQQVGHYRGQHEHKRNGGTHTQRGVNLLAHAQERTDTQELAQYDIVNKYRSDKYQ